MHATLVTAPMVCRINAPFPFLNSNRTVDSGPDFGVARRDHDDVGIRAICLPRQIIYGFYRLNTYSGTYYYFCFS